MAQLGHAWGDNPVTSPPPPIEFLPWREVRTDDISTEYLVQFPSSITTQFAENNTVYVTSMLPSDRVAPVPAVVILHYWGAYDLFVERRMAQQLNRRGIGAVIVSLPYHLQRTPKGRLSGELAITPDPDALVQTMVQSCQDVRRAIDWVQTRAEFKRDQIGISGTSLGAIVASLVLAVEPRVKAATFLIGGVDLAGILWNSSRVVQVREMLRRKGYDEEKLRERLQIVEPETYLKDAPARPALVIGAEYDTIVPVQYTRKLIAGLHDPVVQWLPTGHFGGALAQNGILRSQTDFFWSQFNGADFRGKLTLNAPTIRFGVMTDFEKIEVAAGFDVLRSKSRDYFVSALLSPRQLRLYGGYAINPNLSAGLSVTSRRVSPGLFWSFVF